MIRLLKLKWLYSGLIIWLLALFLPTLDTIQAAPTYLPLRWGYYVRQPTSLDSVRQNIQNLDLLSPYYFVLNADGTIGGSDQPEVTQLARSRGVRVLPMLQNTNSQLEMHNLLVNPQAVQNIVSQIEILVRTYNYDGFHIDFEDMLPQDRPYLTAFMALLSDRLRARSKLVTMAVAAKYEDASNGWAAPYDYAALAPYLDLVSIMTYDFNYSGSQNGPVAPISWVNAVARYAAAQFGSGKVLLGIPFYGYDWNLSRGGQAIAQDYATTQNIVEQLNGIPNFDVAAQSPYVEYYENGNLHRVWYENPRSVAAKLEILQRNNLGGWAVWRLGQEGPEFWPVLNVAANPTRRVGPVPNSPALVYFPETGHTLGSLFLKYWQKYGGLAQFGYPQTEEIEERNLQTGQSFIVQYFERARFEYHPESDNPILLGLLGSQLTENRPSEKSFQRVAASSAPPGALYFAETGHILSDAFLKYWQTNGGLTLYGFPISEAFPELNPADGKTYLVQYFERNRFEYHPENAPNQSIVQLGLLGNQLLLLKGWLAPAIQV